MKDRSLTIQVVTNGFIITKSTVYDTNYKLLLPSEDLVFGEWRNVLAWVQNEGFNFLHEENNSVES